MTFPENTYTGQYTIRAYEIDQNKKLTPPCLIQLMHESSMQNAIDLKVSVWDLEPHNLTWVLRRMKLEVFRYPHLNENIEIKTYPAGFEGIFTYRDYFAFDLKGNLLARSASQWILMNTQTRKLVPIDYALINIKTPSEENALPKPKGALPRISGVSPAMQKVNWYDLDWNGHLNNVVYIRWILEGLNDAFLHDHALSMIDVLFSAEALLGETVLSFQRQHENGFAHALHRKKDNLHLARAITDWEAHR